MGVDSIIDSSYVRNDSWASCPEARTAVHISKDIVFHITIKRFFLPLAKCKAHGKSCTTNKYEKKIANFVSRSENIKTILAER